MRLCWRAWTRPRMCWMAWSQNASWENWAERFRAATRKNYEMQCRRTSEQNGIRYSEHGHEAEGQHVLQAVNGGRKSQKSTSASTHSNFSLVLLPRFTCSWWQQIFSGWQQEGAVSDMLGLGIDPQARLVWIYAAFAGRKTWKNNEKRCMLMYVIYHTLDTLYFYLFTLQNILYQ